MENLRDELDDTAALREETFRHVIATIEHICAVVCRRNRVPDDEIAEFTRHVKFRLAQDDCAILRQFDGRSPFSTYLTVVIQRLCCQYRIAQWGKWRPFRGRLRSR